ncbi:MAG: phosphoribosylglycinamide formyltransferase [Candidatus Magasanikbacteria bacterium]
MSTLHLAILGSTNGTDLTAIYETIKSGKLDAMIDIVISNKSDAGILKKAKNWGLNYKYIEPGLPGEAQRSRDEKILTELQKYPINLILLIGYMRIVSPVLINAYKNKILNVHPSLLPKFAGGMNLDVHSEVIKAGETETGCTIHIVDEGIDTGPIIMQKKCAVQPTDTPETLKQKVQKLEGEAFVEVIKQFS